MDTKRLVDNQRAYFQTGVTLNISFRIKQLQILKEAMKKNERMLLDAIYIDLKKSRYNAITTELSLIHGEISHTIRKLPGWSRRKRVGLNLLNFPEKSYLLPEPYGVAFILGTWNYPYQLSLLPLVSAMGAGNTAIVKPSELVPNTSKAIAKLINDNFAPEYIHVIEGAADVAMDFLQQRFDKIFFTGSRSTGKIIYEAAAKHLTPVTLELGGKNPTILMPDCDIAIAAKRIVWGKFTNAGQTCVAPDYLLVHSSIEQKLLAELKRLLTIHFSSSSVGENFISLVNDNHFERLKRLIDPEKVFFGGVTNSEQRFISPTILHNVTFDDEIMKGEIFGPLLPVIRYDDLNDAVEKVKVYEKPLSFYIFGKRSTITDSLFSRMSFGGGSLNDTVMYLANRNLPFGGVGSSGIGSYHGEYGFRAFSHTKAIMEKKTWMEPWFLKMPPYKEWKLKILRYLIEN
jgi:aldehyde dehydrogenase (NAD+)